MCHHHLHQRDRCWCRLQQVLKLLDQLYRHVLEPLFPTEMLEGGRRDGIGGSLWIGARHDPYGPRPHPYRQTAAAPTRGHLRLDARGESVW